MKDSFEKYYDSVTEKKNKRVFEKSITKIKAFFKGEERCRHAHRPEHAVGSVSQGAHQDNSSA